MKNILLKVKHQAS